MEQIMSDNSSGIMPILITDQINERIQQALSKEIMEAIIKDVMAVAEPFVRDLVKKVSVEGIEMSRDMMKMRDEYRVTFSFGEDK